MESTQETKQEKFQVSASLPVPNVITINSEPKEDEKLVVKKEEDDDEYEDVAEDGLVIVQDNYDGKNEFYDTTVADLIAKANLIPEQKQNENTSSLRSEHPSKEEQTIIVKKEELKSEQEDEVFIQNESDRVKQLMDARRTKKMEQRSLNGQSEENILHPASIQRKTIMAKDHATNPTALYHMQMSDPDPDQVQDQEREIQIEPIKQKKVTNIQNQMWQVSPKITPNIQEIQSTSDQTSEGGGETEPDEQIPSNTHQNQIESQPSTDVETVLDKISHQILHPVHCGGCEREKRDCICDAVERILNRRTPKAKSPMSVQQQTIKFSLDFELTCKIRTNSNDIVEYSPYASD